jgi:serine/threonine-protein kinase
VLPYKKSAVSPDSIGRALKVGTLVQGTVTQADNRLRVDVSLINASSGKELGSKVLERPREEIFALQDDLAKEVSVFLRQQLGAEITLREARQGTTSTKAWELLQRGEQASKDFDPLLAAGDSGAAGRKLVEADSILGLAEAADPSWTAPAIQRGWLAYRQTDLIPGFDRARYSKWLDVGLKHAARALTLKPNDPDGLELRGTLTYWRYLLNLEPEHDAAAKLLADSERDLRAAVEGNPNAAVAWQWLSYLLYNESRTAEGKLAALKSYEADPYLSSARTTLWRLFQTSLDLQDADESKRWCSEGQRRFPQSYRFTECQIWLYALPGTPPDVPKMWQLLDQYLKQNPTAGPEFSKRYGEMLVAIGLARAGLADSARHVAERARGDATVDPTRELAPLEANARMILGDKDEAIRLLTTYLAANPQARAAMANENSWWLKDLRSDPRWRTLLGLPATGAQ